MRSWLGALAARHRGKHHGGDVGDAPRDRIIAGPGLLAAILGASAAAAQGVRSVAAYGNHRHRSLQHRLSRYQRDLLDHAL